MSLLVSGLSTVFAVAGFGGSLYGLGKGYSAHISKVKAEGKNPDDEDVGGSILVGVAIGTALGYFAGQGVGTMIEGAYTFRDGAEMSLCQKNAEGGKMAEFRKNEDGSTSCFINGRGHSSSKPLTP